MTSSRPWFNLLPLALAFAPVQGEDCNRNGVRDVLDLASGTSPDCNLNGLPDECELKPKFRLGGVENFPFEISPGRLAAVDLDGDGLREILTVNWPRYDGANLSILFNKGDRTFERRLSGMPFLTSNTSAIQTGDWDADGNADLAMTLPDPQSVGFLFGDGKGGLGRPASRSVGGKPLSMASVDLDADADNDLAIGLAGGSVVILFGEGNGVFREPVPHDVPGDPSAILSADLDGDGTLDLACVTDHGRAFLLRGKSTGDFEQATDLATMDRRTPGIEPVDLDEDGDIDLAFPTSDLPGLEVYLNDGSGRFEPGQRIELPVQTNTVSGVAAHDWDDDGDEDLVAIVRAPVGSVYIGLNDGRGGIELTDAFIGGLDAVSILPADLDGDGHVDLAVGNVGPDAASVLWHEDSGPLLHSTSWPAGEQLVRLAGGDLDGDGDLDLAASDAGAKAVVILQNEGWGRFEVVTSYPAGGLPGALTASDVEGDGDLDLIALSDHLVEPVRVFRNDGTGGFDGGTGYPAAGRELTFVATADMDGDEALDLLVGMGQSPGIGIHRNEGGAFGPPEVVAVPSFPTSVATADLDGDEDIDLAIAQPHVQEVLLLFHGKPAWSDRVTHHIEREPAFICAPDLDRDGDADLAVLCEGSNDIRVLLNRGTGVLDLLPDRFIVPDDPGFITPTDFNGDGLMDIVARTGYWSVWVLLGNGHGGFPEAKGFSVGTPTNVVAIDLDGDDRVDLATGNGSRVSILKNLSRTASSQDANRDGIPDECGRPGFHRGDSNGNGTIDITDPLHIFSYLFLDDRSLACREAADSNNDAVINISDGLHVLGFLFLGTLPPPTPGPPGTPCGEDPDFPGGPGDIGCAAYTGC